MILPSLEKSVTHSTKEALVIVTFFTESVCMALVKGADGSHAITSKVRDLLMLLQAMHVMKLPIVCY